MSIYRHVAINRRMFLTSALSVGAALLLTPLVSLRAGNNRNLEEEAQTSRYQVVRRMQRELRKQGYDPGTIDGKMGPRTRSTLKRYQTDRGLPATGELDAETLETIGLRTR